MCVGVHVCRVSVYVYMCVWCLCVQEVFKCMYVCDLSQVTTVWNLSISEYCVLKLVIKKEALWSLGLILY